MPLVHGGLSYLSSFPSRPGTSCLGSIYFILLMLINVLEMEWNILRVLTAQRNGFTDAVGSPCRREVFESRKSSR